MHMHINDSVTYHGSAFVHDFKVNDSVPKNPRGFAIGTIKGIVPGDRSRFIVDFGDGNSYKLHARVLRHNSLTC